MVEDADPVPRELAEAAFVGEDGAIQLDRRTLADAAPRAAARLLAVAVTCAGGQASPPRGRRLAALSERLRGDDAFTATLGGAKVSAGAQIVIVREPGRSGLEQLRVGAGQCGVWDGRFEVSAGDRPVVIQALGGRFKALSDKALRALHAIEAPRRPVLPLLERADRPPTCPILAEASDVCVKPLVPARFWAACGTILKEAAT